MTEVANFSDADYAEQRKAIARTPRGRAFLREHEKRARTLAADEVCRMVGEIRDTLRHHNQTIDSQTQVEVLRRELQDMSASIVQARREIAALRPKDGDGSDRIVTATNELDAIVQSTERASFEYLNAAERIMEINGRIRAAGGPDAHCTDLENEVMNIFTACSFQDLTGQRTTKVVNVLRYIEQRVMAMMGIWNPSAAPVMASPIEEPQDKRPDAHLLNGPSDDGIDQGDVDRLLNGIEVPAKPAAAKPAAAVKPSAPAVAEEEPATPAMGQNDIDSLFP